jgi:AraC-like DNA-binding protein
VPLPLGSKFHEDQQMNRPLTFSRVATTTSVDETEHLFKSQLVDSRIHRVESSCDFGVEMNQVSIGSSVLSFINHKSAYEIDCGEVDDSSQVLFGIGCGVPSFTLFNGRSIDLLENAAIITRHKSLKHVRTAGSSEIVLKCQLGDLKLKLQAILDRPVTREFLAESSVSLLQGVGAQAKSTLHFVLNSIDADLTVLENPLIAANFEDLLLGLVLSMPNSYSDLLLRGETKAVPTATVSLAEEYMHAHAQLPITITDVLIHVGCSKKALYSNFRKPREYAPHEFLVRTRLGLAHEKLLNPNTLDTVTSIAYDSGFSHMGRFSEIYRKRYGVRPSGTLKRAFTERGV